MVDYIHFTLLDNLGEERKLKINPDDGNEIYLWRVCKTKPSYWYRCSLNERKGYYRIRVSSKDYTIHRVCYYAHNPNWDIYDSSQDNQIDHRDRNKTNNHITNLRVATHSQNQENQNAKGYYYCNTYRRWVAQIKHNKKLYRKRCKTEEEAKIARAELKKKYHTFV